jgi:hypothetical protein
LPSPKDLVSRESCAEEASVPKAKRSGRLTLPKWSSKQVNTTLMVGHLQAQVL